MNLDNLNLDYLLVNTTNQFLLEYAPIQENSCFKLTGFSGDTGDSLLTSEKEIFLFVDGRYHTQADNEVDHKKVKVVKLNLGQKQDELICDFIKPNTTLGIVAKKVSQSRYEYFKTVLSEKNVNIILLDTDIFETEKVNQNTVLKSESIDFSLCGTKFSDKIKDIKKPSLFTNSEEISYLCNLRNFSQNYASKIDGKLFISNEQNVLFTDYKTDTIENLTVKPLEDFDNFIKNISEEIYVDKSTINAYDYSIIKTPINITSPAKLMKSMKNKSELEHLKYAFEMTDKALSDTRDFIYEKEELSEYEIDKKLEENFKKYGAKLLSFKSIIARNENSALAHYMNSSKTEIVKDGDLVLIDCGAYYEGGLATDITRVFVKGEPTEKQKQVYTTVLKMFLNAFYYPVTENKTSGYEIDAYVRKYLEDNNIDNFAFSHGLGHGIGICVHESPPNLSKNEIAKTPLKNNMCFTIEPGLYNDDFFGIRLENSCYLENGIIKSFTDMCYEKKLISFSMLTEQEKEWLSEFKVL